MNEGKREVWIVESEVTGRASVIHWDKPPKKLLPGWRVTRFVPAEASKGAGQAWALPERHVVALWLARHALIEYAAQRHPQAALLDLCQLLSWAVEALPGAANALGTANALAATGGPFRSGDALKLYMQQGPLEPPSKHEGGSLPPEIQRLACEHDRLRHECAECAIDDQKPEGGSL